MGTIGLAIFDYNRRMIIFFDPIKRWATSFQSPFSQKIVLTLFGTLFVKEDFVWNIGIEEEEEVIIISKLRQISNSNKTIRDLTEKFEFETEFEVLYRI